MKIEYRTGDLLKSSLQAIAHGCNSQGVMGSGIAKQIKEQYPDAFKMYRIAFVKSGLQIGTNIWSSYNNTIIVNCITQPFFGNDKKRYVSYDAISDCMKDINSNLFNAGIYEIGLPLIGAGLGGGNWNIISSIIEEELTKIKPIVFTL